MRYIGGAARPDRQPRRRPGRPPRRRARAATTTTPTSSSPPTRARRRSRTPPTGSAEERGFWLGDAFASGGSAGYDHKALGITARGAWESVKRHFRELDLDPRPTRSRSSASATCPATCSATGCCSRTRSGSSPPTTTATSSSTPTRTRPPASPSAAAVRAPRLDLGRLRPRAISAGGGVWPRSAKSIPLSAQARAALGVEDETPAAERRDPRDPARAGRPAVERRHRHGREGGRRRRDDDAQDRASDAIRVDGARPALPGGGGGRQPRPHAPRPGRVRRAAAG